ncbi:shadow of prion protein 2 [Xyrauchen texanus]|uniref:shadow of prion protein 2 n=1 Tax=Xyrauchen texanus TaxID=154827 RepID=UPI002242A42B|nr:shadow of prion protein 2 [Xyrauchen texanus]
MANQKLLIVWVWILLVATLCPWANCKLGRGFGGKSKGVGQGAKEPPSQSKGSSRQGLKLAGAAAAGAIGGAAIGYGLGSLGRPRYGHGYDGHGYHNRSDWQYNRSAASSDHVASILMTLGALAHFFIWN